MLSCYNKKVLVLNRYQLGQGGDNHFAVRKPFQLLLNPAAIETALVSAASTVPLQE